ncbi:hypothetical protein [Blastococcus sp. PRF04-17]|uniref:hypothetical protein n=1 Tax=Blastococcus sp. PRF04-17 TaxID=2933797 RepID=UPI001FF215DF|nr:hypothetical protein [Blastococcus sp. PRF04-17]UOY01924.1 hypothetical protein MVA48_00625 [Blastococcus sp. PRF04-17]
MTRADTRTAALALALTAGLLAGCTSGSDGEPEPTASSSPGSPLPARPTDASTDLEPYRGPPDDAPGSLGPLTTLRGVLDLTAATPGVFARADAAVATPDGGAVVLLTPRDPDLPHQVVSVAPGSLAVLASVPLPRMHDVWDVHLADDGAVVVSGQLRTPDGGASGFSVVDPATGAVSSRVVVPLRRGTVSATGRSALAGGALYLFSTVERDDGVDERLVAVDVRTGVVVEDRDVTDDVAAVSQAPVGRQLAGLVARPDGGVTVAFDASPTEVLTDRIPTLLRFDASLRPDGKGVRATDLAEGAETQAVAATPDGTVFLLVEVDEGGWILAIPEGGGAGPLLAQIEDRIFTYALVVEPAQVWALIPAAEGVRAVDLTTGEVRGSILLGCSPRLDVRALLPAPGGALLIGECDTPREDTQLLWFVGP